MPEWRSSFWLGAASIYAVSVGAAYGKHWDNLAFWTRAHASLDLCTGFWMLVGALALILVRTGVRPRLW